jgi:hypothetical protein
MTIRAIRYELIVPIAQVKEFEEIASSWNLNVVAFRPSETATGNGRKIKRFLTQEQKNAALLLSAKGRSDIEVGRHFDVAPSVIWRLRKTHNQKGAKKA